LREPLLFLGRPPTRVYSASLFVVLSFCVLLLMFFCRVFALKAQDRAIRAEENLRHFALTGKLLDPRLTIRQIIGLRFASDDEFVALAQAAASEIHCEVSSGPPKGLPARGSGRTPPGNAPPNTASGRG
jgi:hypothetical protein